MSGYVLTWRSAGDAGALDGSILRPDTLGALSRDELLAGPVGKCFEVEGEPGDKLVIVNAPPLDRVAEGMQGGALVIEGSVGNGLGSSMTDGKIVVTGSAGGRVGAGMQGGAIVVEGDAGDDSGASMTAGNIVISGSAGDRAGAKMQSGALVIEGDAGDDLGASMIAGRIVVSGSAGNRAGGPAPQADRGMRGGEIVIHGNAGEQTGLMMRRGLIAVAGTCGSLPGYRMLAGTIVIGTGPLERPGLEMRRGTIACFDASADHTLGKYVAVDGTFEAASLTAVGLVRRRLEQIGFESESLGDPTHYTFYSGDRFELNKGELWLATPSRV